MRVQKMEAEQKRPSTTKLQRKKFVLYQRVFYETHASLRRIYGEVEMPSGILEVKKYIQNPQVYGIKILNPVSYVQNENGIFKPEEPSIQDYTSSSREKLDSVVLAHSLKTGDTRSQKIMQESVHVVIRTRFAEGIIRGEISDVPALKNVNSTEDDIRLLEGYLKNHTFIVLFRFDNACIDDLFSKEEHWDSKMYKKPHCIIINSGTITEYGFQKK